jgi:hypothetical protein
MEIRIHQEIGELFDMQPTREYFEIPLEGLCKDILGKVDKKWVMRTLHDMGITGAKKTTRGQYPRRTEGHTSGLGEKSQKEMTVEYVAFLAKPYTFYRKNFTDSPLLTQEQADELLNPVASTATTAQAGPPENKDDLPF